MTLRTVVVDFDLFAISDADGRLPPDFLARMAGYFALDPDLGFVQANHRSLPESEVGLARDFGVCIDASWYRQQIARNRYGLVAHMGHGVVVRREAWERAGSFPEVVQEDTAFTIALREAGYYGYFAEDVVCYEEFPPAFNSNRRRYFRLVQADTELLAGLVRRFLAAEDVSAVEKLDLLARTTRIPASAIVLSYIVLTAIIVPWLSTGFFAADAALQPLLSWKFALWNLFSAAAPVYPFVVHLYRRPLRLLRLVLQSLSLYHTFLVVSLASIVVYAARGGATFVVTGSGETTAGGKRVGAVRGFLGRLSAKHPLVITLEVGSALLLGLAAAVQGNLVLLGIGLALLEAPFFTRFGWDNRLLAVVNFIPPALILIGVIGGVVGLLGPQSQYLGLVGLSILLVF